MSCSDAGNSYPDNAFFIVRKDSIDLAANFSDDDRRRLAHSGITVWVPISARTERRLARLAQAAQALDALERRHHGPRGVISPPRWTLLPGHRSWPRLCVNIEGARCVTKNARWVR
jgi:hypothetical protein